MSFALAPHDPDKPLTPGVYQITAKVSGVDARSLAFADIKRSVQRSYGDRVEALDYAATNREDLVLSIQVHPLEAPPTQNGIQSFSLVAALYAGAVLAAALGFLFWQIRLTVIKVDEVVEEIKDTPGGQLALGGFGIGTALLGLAAVAWVVWPRKGSDG